MIFEGRKHGFKFGGYGSCGITRYSIEFNWINYTGSFVKVFKVKCTRIEIFDIERKQNYYFNRMKEKLDRWRRTRHICLVYLTQYFKILS